MNCEQFQDVMLDLARDAGEDGCDAALDAATVKDALEHIEVCGTCDELLEEAEAITASLREIASRHSSDVAPNRVEKALLRTLDVRRSVAAHAALRRRLLIGSVAGVAAMALMAISLAWNGGTSSSRVALGQAFGQVFGRVFEKASPRASQKATGPELQTESAALLADNSAGDLGGMGFGDDDKIPNSFVPLSQTFDPASVDDDTVVRVVLSRAALGHFGLHVDSEVADRADDQVVADLILTNDGTPQAIRVVGW
jgi:hypothetical protein